MNETKVEVTTKMAKFPLNFSMISLLATVSSVLGCGVMPAGQGSEPKIAFVM
ncbi:hypothetical protein KIN20_029422 [Parelaphostrongylus tenuis]|uniref:Uncharacterized protein n=1 Tax=Parelaphostrongylus tenuis TaxID=148309 RepID=A0AAD5WFJ7_PARTN|nr:hypothetical protein KIN20_029422 [Parelaphostrongylus tenuis]